MSMNIFDTVHRQPYWPLTLIRNGSAAHIWPELITLLATMAEMAAVAG